MTAVQHEFRTYSCDGCYSEIKPKERFVALYRGTVRAEQTVGTFAGNDGSWGYHFHEACFREHLAARLTLNVDFERVA